MALCLSAAGSLTHFGKATPASFNNLTTRGVGWAPLSKYFCANSAAPLVLPGGTPDNPCDPTVANELLACVISSFSYNSLINVLLLESVHYFAMYVNLFELSRRPDIPRRHISQPTVPVQQHAAVQTASLSPSRQHRRSHA